MYDREDRCTSSDAQSERQYSGYSEPGTLPHATEGVAHILDYLLSRHQLPPRRTAC